jgi:riboflavin synthase
MFTGIVAAVGCIEQIEPLGDQPDAGVRLTIHAGDLDIADVRLGDSIAIQGACMTVLTLAAPRFVVEVSRESLNTTVGLAACGPVNLEKAMRLSDRLGGHMVSGHVDGLGTLLALDPVGESWRMQIRVPATLARYLAYKGSVTINGISLTVNQVVDQSDGSCAIAINVIAHTMTATTLKHVAVGDQVNLEIDLIARYVERILAVANDA